LEPEDVLRRGLDDLRQESQALEQIKNSKVKKVAPFSDPNLEKYIS